MEYVKIPSVVEKLKFAEERNFPVWISASTGYGKTSAVMDFYMHKSIFCISGKTGVLSQMPNFLKIRQTVVFADDVSFLTDEASQQYLIQMIREKHLHVILAGRNKFPEWVEDAALSQDFIFISAKELAIQKPQVVELFENNEIYPDDKTIDELISASSGYPVALLFYAKHMLNGEEFNLGLVQKVKEDTFRFWDRTVFENYDAALCNLLLALCVYSPFTEEFAVFLTGNHEIKKWLFYMEKTGQYMIRSDENLWRIRPEVMEFLQWKRIQCWSDKKQAENYRRSAYWYEMHDHISEALYYYNLAGAEEEVKELLIKNASKHPGAGHYYHTRKYYEALPEKTILEDPVLIAGMSMLCSLMLNPEGSEEWYQKLVDYADCPNHPKQKRKEARNKIVYLDISLPHRAGAGIIKIFQNTFRLVRNGEVKLQEFSVTSNIPSVMNGGLDFCKWSKNDNAIAKFLGPSLEVVLGKHGRGLVDIALAESYLEKGNVNPYEIVTRLNNGISDAVNGGKMEMIFTATGLLVKQHLLQGQYPTAKRRIDAFAKKLKEEHAEQLVPNFEAFCAWFSLYMGDKETVQKYVASAPDEKTDFYVLDRYRYMVKIRCLIAENYLAEALDLASFLTRYFDDYKRTYLTIENEVLKAVILYRMENESWKSVLISALQKAEEYHFIRVFSLEGAAMLPLLNHLEADDFSGSFLKAILDETKRMALYYPDYLKIVSDVKISFTNREMQILGMLCRGLTMQEICEECAISYSGLKKHNRNIYQKLGAKTRAEAERTALQLGIIHRKGREL